jgi:hypothetical protein
VFRGAGVAPAWRRLVCNGAENAGNHWVFLKAFEMGFSQQRCASVLFLALILLEKMMVPRDRIELPTRGFSIHCSTD